MKSGRNGMFGFGGGYTTIVSKIFDVLMLGVLCVVCCIPVVTAGASLTALYYAIVKSVKNDDGYASTMFFRSFKRNWKPATVLWIVVAVVVYLMMLNIGILMEKTSGTAGLVMMGFYAAVCVYVVLMACYMFPALSRFDMPVFWFLRIAVYMVVRYFLTSLVLAFIVVTGGALVWRVPLLIFVVPGPAAWLAAEFLERVLAKHAPAGNVPEENEAESAVESNEPDKKI